jgi:hypothetical protein
LQRIIEANIKQELSQSPKTNTGTAVTMMKSPSQAQNINTITSPITLANSMLHTWLLNADFPVSSVSMTNTSPESEAVQLQRLLMTLNAAIALADEDIFDSDPDETPQSHSGALA